ncbi:hypothetical protein, partial [Plasmodium yoelii yoelii]
MYNLIVILPS